MSANFGRTGGDAYRRAAHRILDGVKHGGVRVSPACVEWALSHLGDLGRYVPPPARAGEIARSLGKPGATA